MSVKIAERLERVRPYGERRIALGPGVVWFSNPDLGTGLCFPIQRLGYRVRLTGPAGAVEAFLTFVNPTTQTQNATFLFPLDRNVAPVKIRGTCGERQIETEVGPAPDPSEEDEQASLPAELCRLFQEETENVLAIPLGEIPSGGTVTFQLLLAHMVLECGEAGLGFSFRLPLMTSQALTTLKDEDREQLTLASGLDRGAQVAISIQIEASDLEPGGISTSQVCGVARGPNGDLAVEYDRRKPLEGRDFVLDYQLWMGNRPKAWLRSQGRHFLLNFLPPGNPPPSNPRRLVILVDGSEEMNRVGIKRCVGCLSFILKNLAPEDKFALVAFNREVSGYKNGDFVDANLADEAVQWLTRFQFEGGADLKELLRRVVTLPRQQDSVLSVVLVTAGKIGNEPELYRLLQGSRDILRLFPIMLGHRADPHFARAAARLTGGYAFRALTQDSVSRVAERVLEHTRQPVLEGVGLQDKGLQYQGDSLTPKYPTGLNWRRPITVMGAHTGRGGLEAGGSGPGGAAWSEYLELKPAFHKVLANVWAQVKSTELDDEAQMLDRAERGILQNVIKNLSREFKLLNRFTAAIVRSSDQEDFLAPALDAGSWYRRIERDVARGQSANELLEKQRNHSDLKGGISKHRNPGRGLTMKDVLGSKSTAAIYGSKLSNRSKLSPSVKEGLFSKPMLKSRKDVAGGAGGPSTATGGNSTAVAVRGTSSPSVPEPPQATPVSPQSFEPLPQPPQPPQTTPVSPPELEPGPEPSSLREPDPTPGPPRSSDVSESPTTRLGPPPTLSPVRSPVISVDEDPDFDIPGMYDPPSQGLHISKPPDSVEEVTKRVSAPRILRSEGGAFRPPTISSRLPTISALESSEDSLEAEPEREREPEPPPQRETVSIPEPAPVAPIPKGPDPELQQAQLPTPRELAARVSPQARQGNPEETARNALKSEPQTRQSLMAEMRLLHSSLGEVVEPQKILELTDAVLFRLAGVAPKAELLVRAYGLGYQARGMLPSNLEEGKGKLKFWLTRFAKLF